jgi:hypothetical protein
MNGNNEPGQPVDQPAAPKIETPAGKTDPKPDQADKAEEEKQSEIPIKQVPMDGICGGY